MRWLRSIWDAIVAVWNWLLSLRRIEPVSNLTITFTGRSSGNMEIIKVAWTPSPSYNVDRHEVWAAEDGGAPQKKADCIASAIDAEIGLTTGCTASVFVRTVGDNDTQADSPPTAPFPVRDQTQVHPVGGVTATWVRHVP